MVDAAGRLALFPVRAALGSPLGSDARRRVKDAALDAAGGADVEHLLDQLLAGPLPEALARSVRRRSVGRRLTREILSSAPARSTADAELMRELVDRVCASAAFDQVLERALSSEVVKSALAEQGESLVETTAAALRDRLIALDVAAESTARRWARRDERIRLSQEAGFVTRGVSLAVDALLVHLVFLIVVALVALSVSLAGGLSLPVESAFAAAGWSMTVTVYFVFCWTFLGRTPGMALLRLRVLASSGREPGVGRSLVRLVGLALSLALVFVGFLPALIDDRRRALPDFLAGTTVVHDQPNLS